MLVAVMFLLVPVGTDLTLIVLAIWARAWLCAMSGSRRAKGLARAAAIFSLVVLVLQGILVALVATNY